MGDTLGKQAQNVASSVADASAKVASTQSFQAVAGAAQVVREEIELGQIGDKIYRPPAKLRKRTQQSSSADAQDIAPNTEAMGIELHKDSKFYQSWEKFKDTNPYVNKMLDWKIKFDESENPVIKASRLLTNKVLILRILSKKYLKFNLNFYNFTFKLNRYQKLWEDFSKGQSCRIR